MNELELPSLAKIGKTRDDTRRPLPMQEIDEAYKTCRFGIFHIMLLFTSFVGIVAGVLSSNTTGYLLPSAECDLQMSLFRKGLLNAIPYLGMLFSTVIAGFLTDTFGRKIFVVFGSGGMFFFMFIAGLSQTYEVLITAKFMEGVLFATSFSAIVSLTAEFCHNGIRDHVLLCQSSFAAVAQVLTPAMSWVILTQDWSFSLFGGCFESQIFNNAEKFDEARNILVNIYRLNTGKPAETCPTKSGTGIYVNSIIIGCVCLLPYFVTGVLVNKVGKKILLITAGSICVAMTCGLRWADSKAAFVTLFSINLAMGQVMLSFNQALIVEFFPTISRTLAVSLIMLSGRIGTLVGNIAFPIVLDMACIIPFFTLAGMMLCVIMVSYFFPTEK